MSPTLVVVCGLPGSGKTTLAAEWVAQDPAGRVRMDRDCLRDMLHPGCYISPDTEHAVMVAALTAARALLAAGYDVISDDTNLRPERMADWRALAADAGARFEVIDLTGVPVAACVERDARRPDRGYPPSRWDGARVGAGVIEGMAGRYLGAAL